MNFREKLVKCHRIYFLVAFISSIPKSPRCGAEEPEINSDALERIPANRIPKVRRYTFMKAYSAVFGLKM